MPAPVTHEQLEEAAHVLRLIPEGLHEALRRVTQLQSSTSAAVSEARLLVSSVQHIVLESDKAEKLTFALSSPPQQEPLATSRRTDTQYHVAEDQHDGSQAISTSIIPALASYQAQAARSRLPVAPSNVPELEESTRLLYGPAGQVLTSNHTPLSNTTYSSPGPATPHNNVYGFSSPYSAVSTAARYSPGLRRPHLSKLVHLEPKIVKQPSQPHNKGQSLPSGPVRRTYVLPSTAKKQMTGRKTADTTSAGPAQLNQLTVETAEQKRERTQRVRTLGACFACRLKKRRCNIDSDDPQAPCRGALKDQARNSRAQGPRLSVLSWTRHKLVDTSLFREQKTPNPEWTERWPNMIMENITVWANSRRMMVTVTNGWSKIGYELEVQEFIPVDGDCLDETWYEGPNLRRHPIPPFAISDMGKAAEALSRYVDRSVGPAMTKYLLKSDQIVENTYLAAFKHMEQAQDMEERTLLRNTMRLWVTCRMTSSHEWFQQPFGSRVEHSSSPFYGKFPVSPLICAQLELIQHNVLQRPYMKLVLHDLQRLFKRQDDGKRQWFTIYLTTFMLLHSCSLLTMRDAEWARERHMFDDFANPACIERLHFSMDVLLYYFHNYKKGSVPIRAALDKSKHESLQNEYGLTAEQVQLVHETALWSQTNELYFRTIRDLRQTSNDRYFICQLFDDEWEARKPT